jgi:hypothetical protein
MARMNQPLGNQPASTTLSTAWARASAHGLFPGSREQNGAMVRCKSSGCYRTGLARVLTSH